MSCYVPYCFSGVPYFSVLTKCGFEEQGGIVDCIQPVNMSGINELLVSQSDSAMSRHHPERLHELEALLEFPSQVSAAELDSRFQELCKVIEKARDTFSCRLDEEQENPFQELRVQLQKAKDRFHVRFAGENNNKKPLRSSRFKTQSVSKNVQNPFQELRDAFRMARKHFIPLIDQYISTGNNNIKAIRDQGGSRLGGHYKPNSVDTSSVDSSTTLSTNPMEDDSSKPRPSITCTETSSPETVSVEVSKENAADCCCTILSESPTEDCSIPRPSNASEEKTSGETVCVEINEEAVLDCCRGILRTNPTEDCSKMQPSCACNDMSSPETLSVEINKDNAVDSSSIISANPTDDYSESRSLNSCKEVNSGAAPSELLRGGTPCDSSSFSEAVTEPNQSTVSRLEALISKELQRRKGGVKLLENQDVDDGYRVLMAPITSPAVEGEAGTFEQLSSTGEDLSKHGLRGSAPGLVSKLTILGQDPTSPLESDTYDKTFSTDCEERTIGDLMQRGPAES